MEGLSREFEALSAQLLEQMGFEVAREVMLATIPLDIVASKNGDIEFVVEAKLIRQARADLTFLRNLISRAKSILTAYTFEQQAIFLSCMVAPEHKEWLSNEYKIAIWDRQTLLDNAGSFRPLAQSFADFFRRLDTTEPPKRPLPVSALSIQEVTPGDTIEPDLDLADDKPTNRGAELATKLQGIAKGKKGAKAYEQVVIDIIKYLFGDFLLDARPQHRIEDSLSILDIIFRVATGHPFWDTLTRDFRARVMVFECKNYTKPIKPAQLYTTERYVSASALRPVCFIVSRSKPHEHTELAAFGAMREGGKLFVFLDDDDLCEMLHIRDAQLRLKKTDADYMSNDPTVLLDQKIYDFLGRMPR